MEDSVPRWSASLERRPVLHALEAVQVQVSIPTPPYAFGANVGDARVYGIESSLEWQPLAGLHLSLTGNYNDARLVSDAFQGEAPGRSGRTSAGSAAVQFQPDWPL